MGEKLLPPPELTCDVVRMHSYNGEVGLYNQAMPRLKSMAYASGGTPYH